MAVIEILTFRLRPGHGEQEFIAADERVRTGFLYYQGGFVRATTARSRDGRWAVITVWATDEAADAAAASATPDTAWSDFDALIDAESVHRVRYDTLD